MGQGDEGLQLPDDVPGGGVPCIQHTPVHGILDLEGRNDGTGGRQVQLEPPAGVLLDRLHQQLRCVLDDGGWRPGALHLPHDRGLGRRDGTAVCSEEVGDETDRKGQRHCHFQRDKPLHRDLPLNHGWVPA